MHAVELASGGQAGVEARHRRCGGERAASPARRNSGPFQTAGEPGTTSGLSVSTTSGSALAGRSPSRKPGAASMVDARSWLSGMLADHIETGTPLTVAALLCAAAAALVRDDSRDAR